MKQHQYDAIVIGAGLGGLTAAALLARAHKRVLVLERQSQPGGYARAFQHEAFRFDIALHALDGAAPGGWSYDVLRRTGALERLELSRLDPIYVARSPARVLTVPSDLNRYKDELCRHFPGQAAGIQALFRTMLGLSNQARQMLQAHSASGCDLQQLRSRAPELAAAMEQSWDAYVRQFVGNPQLIAGISVLCSYLGQPPTLLNALTFMLSWVSFHVYGAFYPRGGSRSLADALAQIVTENGGEFRYEQTVARIAISDGRAAGIETETGFSASASTIIANSNIPDTFLTLIDRQELPGDFVASLERKRPSLSHLGVYLALKGGPEDIGWPHQLTFVSGEHGPEAEYQAALQGDWKNTHLVISNYSVADTPAPPEYSVLTLFSLASIDYQERWGTHGVLAGYQSNPGYRAIKQAAGEALIDRAAAYIPELRARICHQEISTPLTNWRYSLNRAGAIYGFAHTASQLYVDRPPNYSPIENLFLAGAWAHYCGGMSAAMYSGADAARRAIAYLAHADAAPVRTSLVNA